jgi:porin
MITDKPFKQFIPGTILLLALCGPAIAQAADADADNSDSIWTRDKLTGDWGGARSSLSDDGIDIGLRLSQYGQRVTTGGLDVNSETGGTMDYRLNLDGDKLFGAKGFAINAHARSRWGKDVTADAGGTTLENTGMLMPAPGDWDKTELTGLTVSQYLPIFGLSFAEAGKIDVIDTLGLFFPSVAGGQEGFWNANAMVSALPWFGAVRGLSLYGALGTTINTDHKIPQTGFLVTGTENVSTGGGSDSFDDGAWVAAFHRFIWTKDDHMGYFMIFAGGSTRDQPSNDKNDVVIVPGQGLESTEEHKPWDIAMYFYQDFWQAPGDPKRKANFMIGGTVGPDNPQFSQYNLFGNVEVYGLMDSRPRDRMGVGAWWNSVSDNFEDLVSPVVDLQDQYGMEIYYNYEVNKWLHVSPDLQVVELMLADADTAVIAGLRLVVDF